MASMKKEPARRPQRPEVRTDGARLPLIGSPPRWGAERARSVLTQIRAPCQSIPNGCLQAGCACTWRVCVGSTDMTREASSEVRKREGRLRRLTGLGSVYKRTEKGLSDCPICPILERRVLAHDCNWTRSRTSADSSIFNRPNHFTFLFFFLSYCP